MVDETLCYVDVARRPDELELANKLLHITNIHLNNPITNMRLVLEYPHPLTYNPKIDLNSIPCGYYPLAECRVATNRPPLELKVERTGNQWHFQLINLLNKEFCDVSILFALPKSVD